MGTYNLPRNVKGEGRILFVFSTKALIYSLIGVVIGLIFYFIFKTIGTSFIGGICVCACGLIGFVIGTFKVPDSTAFEITKKTGGENIDEVIKRAIRFKMKKNRIYVYKQEEVEKKEVTKDD